MNPAQLQSPPTVTATVSTQAAHRTLLRPAIIRGVGLFTGKPATIVIRPPDANPDSGGTPLRFLRTDLPGSPAMPVRAAYARASGRCTTLTCPQSGAAAQTVEHVLAALAGLGVGHAVLELDGPEAPMMDGSALPFVRAMLGAGLLNHDAQQTPDMARARQPWRLDERITVQDGAATIEAEPVDGPALELEYHLDYGSGPIAPQRASLTLTPGAMSAQFVDEVAPARTFSLEAEARAARQMGLFAHLTPRDMLVIAGDGEPIENQWRMPNEPARHKLLDLLGDLALAGLFSGRVVARRSGHALNVELARRIEERRQASLD